MHIRFVLRCAQIYDFSCSEVKSTDSSNSSANSSGHGTSLDVVAVKSVFKTGSISHGNLLERGVNANGLLVG